MTTESTTGPSRTTLLLGLGALVLLAAVGAAVIALTGGDDDTQVDAGGDTTAETIPAFETGPVQITGTYLPRLAANPDPAVGSPVPRIDGISFDGEPVRIGGDGAPRLYGFFAHWCPHCQDELPRTSAWLASNDLPGTVDLVAVSTGVSPDADNYPPSAWFDREGWPLDVVIDSDDGTIGQAFGLSAYPFWVGADADGNVAFRATGGLSEDQLVALLDLLATDS